MSDFGSASNNGELNVGSAPTSVFLEIHTANSVSTPTGSGIPGGLALGAAGLNQLGPGDFSGSSPTAYGTVSNGGAVTPVFINFQGTLPQGLFRLKNPG